ncbi:magnesium transporter MgtE N-terminal domain-containing protein [Marinobacterium arenosum]|uniref:magnesium transporter MgtE N-terminal domain-containing protein n=1 Tax=Marinobacterium arenosum TaxID=2862496 RepID=UPI001C95DC5A|nr:CBS domain-containing protein [Marinobacterium arenosum]MBY4676090.1 CBS domain-containing protein [Marinobacterium arenosum]
MTDPLALGMMEAHPEQAARVLAGLEADELTALLVKTPERTAARLLRYLPSPLAAQCLQRLPAGKAAALVALLPTAQSVPLMQLIEQPQHDALMRQLPMPVFLALRLVQGFPEGSVGATMDPQPTTLPADIRVDEALRLLRAVPQHLQQLVFVLDGQQRLVGQVAVQDLLLANRRDKLVTLMQPAPQVFTAKTPLSAIEQHPIWFSETLAPVVDRKGVFLGVLRQQRMVDALNDSPAQEAPVAGDSLLDLAELLWSATGSLLLLMQPDDGRRREDDRAG